VIWEQVFRKLFGFGWLVRLISSRRGHWDMGRGGVLILLLGVQWTKGMPGWINNAASYETTVVRLKSTLSVPDKREVNPTERERERKENKHSTGCLA
jgi:hypothetical protein